MNLIQIQDQLKGLPTQAIMGYANGQNPEVPPYVALAELNRRKQMQSGAMAGQGGQKPTIKDQITQSTGLMGLQNAQQQQAMQQVARAPQQGPVPQGAPEGPVQGAPEGFAGGGAIAFAEGGDKGLDDAVYDPVTGALISGGDSDKTDLSLSEVLAKKVNPDYAPYRETKKPVGIASVASRPVRSAPSQVQQDQQTGLQAAIDQQQAKLPAPAVVAQRIAQGAPKQEATPAAAPEGLEAVFNKQAIAAMQAKPDLQADMAVADKAMPRSKYESEYEQSIRDQRAADLARRKVSDSGINTEGLMAQLRGFAQADPRRAFGAGAAASADFQQQQLKQRAAEDALFREGLGALNKAEQERVKASFEYAVGQGKDVNAAKKAAMGDVAQALVAKGNNATTLLATQMQTAATMGAARINADTREGIAAGRLGQADSALLQKVSEAVAKEKAQIAKDPKYASAAYNPALAADRAAKEADVIRRYVAQYPQLKDILGGSEAAAGTGINTAQWGQPSIVSKK